jgi:hypothetical protein
MRVFMSPAHIQADTGGQTLRRIGDLLEAVRGPSIHVLGQLCRHGFEKILRVGQIVVDRATRHACSLGQLLDIDLGDAPLGKKAKGCFMNTQLGRCQSRHENSQCNSRMLIT